MGIDLDTLKNDLDKLADLMRKTDEDLYNKLTSVTKDFSDLNVSVKLVVNNLNQFIDTFKSHDENEMKKYGDILEMFKEVQKSAKEQEAKYVTKEEFSALQKLTKENGDAIKEGWKLFYKVSGGLTVLIVFGGLIMYILNLISKLQALGVN